MFRASEALLGQGLRARAAVLEAGEDPDSYVRGRGTGALGELIDRASGALDFFSDEAFSNWDAGRPEGKSAIAERLAPLLRSLREPVLQEASVNQLASRLALQPATVWKALKKGARRELTAKGEGAEPGEEAPRELNRLECCLLNRLMRRDAPLAFVETLEEDLFSEAILKSLFLRIREAARRKAAEKAGSPDWIELFQDENEIQAMNHVLFIEERHLGGALAAQPLSAVICGDLEIECREMAARLRRKRSMRLRGQAVRELRFQFSELDRAREGLGRVHRHAWSVSQQTRMLVEESGQTSAGGNQV
jgi:DNA primase